MIKIVFQIIATLVVLTFPLGAASAQQITSFQSERVEDYHLPYPGLLPDNPLFVIKHIRDTVQLMTAGSPQERAAILVQFADKDMAASVKLFEKGKHKLSDERASRAGQRLQQAFEIAASERFDAVEDKKELLTLIDKSNRKHIETIEELMKNAPQGQVQQLEKLRQGSLELRSRLAKTMQ